MTSGGAGTPVHSRRREGLFEGQADVPILGARKSRIIEEEDELFEEHAFEDEEVEEVDGFSPVNERRPTFMQGRTSNDALSSPTVTATADALASSVLSSPNSIHHKSSDLQLLPAAEIEEPSYPAFHASGTQSDPELLHPPRSSSLRERKTSGSPGNSPLLESS